MQKIGVFVCWCGSNIAATVDVHAVAEALGKEPGVVTSVDYQYMCSQACLLYTSILEGYADKRVISAGLVVFDGLFGGRG